MNVLSQMAMEIKDRISIPVYIKWVRYINAIHDTSRSLGKTTKEEKGSFSEGVLHKLSVHILEYRLGLSDVCTPIPQKKVYNGYT